MKKKLLLVTAICLVAGGCATAPKGSIVVEDPSEVPSVQRKYAGRLSSLKIGMTLEDFRQILPEAYVAGQSGQMTAYELTDVTKYVTQADIDYQNFWYGFGSPRARTAKSILWFYFSDDRLVRWGRPQDWPKEPDVIVEKRIR
jgi:hypothetical protein